jgi:hypothetical protein
MNGPPIPPLPGDFDADEALNALVDGELGAFAAEQSLDEAIVRDRLVAMPDFAARRAALEQTRAAVRAPVPPLDDVTRRRLVGNATSAAPKPVPSAPRSRRWVALTAIAAAGLLVVAGVGVAVSSLSNDSSSSSSKSASSSGTAPLHGDVGDLGDVTSAAALRSLLDRRAAGDTTTTQPPRAQSQFARGGAASDAVSAPAPSAASTAACAQQLAGHRTVAFTGVGTYQGAPVTIVGITTGGRTIVFVVSDADCTDVVASISR